MNNLEIRNDNYFLGDLVEGGDGLVSAQEGPGWYKVNSLNLNSVEQELILQGQHNHALTENGALQNSIGRLEKLTHLKSEILKDKQNLNEHSLSQHTSALDNMKCELERMNM